MKIKVHVSTGYVGSRRETEVEIDDEDLRDLTDDEQHELIEEHARTAMWDMVEWGWDECD